MTTPRWRASADAWFKLLAAIVLGYVVLAQIAHFLVRFGELTIIAIGGVLLAYFFYPAVHWLNARLPLWAALTITYCGTALAFILAFFLAASPIVSQVQALTHTLPHLQRRITAFLADPRNPYISHIPEPIHTYLIDLPITIETAVRANLALLAQGITGVLLSAVNIGAIVVAIPIVSIYMLAESAMIKRYLLERIPDRHRAETRSILADVDAVIGGFVRGQLIVAGCVAVLVTVALFALGVPDALVVGVWAGVADIIPYIGPFVGGILAVMIAAIAGGWIKVVLVVIALTLINQIEAHLLSPRVVGRSVRVAPLLVIFALLIGGSAYGIPGLLLAVPVAGVIRVLVDHLVPSRELLTVDVKPGLTQAPHDTVHPFAKPD